MLLRKQSLREELRLELFICCVKIAQPFRLHRGDVELVGSVPRIDGDASGTDHAHSVLGTEAEPRSVGAKHDAPDRCASILERKVMMPGRIDLIIGQLAADINAAQRAVAFHDGADVLRDLRYGERRNLRHSSEAVSGPAATSSAASPRERIKLPRMPLIKRTVSGSSYPLASSTASLMDAAAGISGI